MNLSQHTFNVKTNGRGTIELTDYVLKIISQASTKEGLCHIFYLTLAHH